MVEWRNLNSSIGCLYHLGLLWFKAYLTKSGALEMTCSNSANDRESSSSRSASSKI